MTAEAPIFVRTSERSTFKTCRQRWQWSYGEGRRGRRTSAPLWFGDLVHQSMALYYPPGKRRGPKPFDSFERLFEESLKGGASAIEQAVLDEHYAYAENILPAYASRFKADEKGMEVIGSEIPFSIPIKVRGRTIARYVGTIDGLVRYPNGSHQFREYKTTGSAPNFRHLQLDDQAGAYWSYAPAYLRKVGLLPRGARLDGIEYTFMRKAKRDGRPVDAEGLALNKDGSVSKSQPAPILWRELVPRTREEMASNRLRVAAEIAEIAGARAGTVAVYKNPGPLFRSNCDTCSFRDACIAHEAAAPGWRDILDFDTEDWDPYEDHR